MKRKAFLNLIILLLFVTPFSFGGIMSTEKKVEYLST